MIILENDVEFDSFKSRLKKSDAFFIPAFSDVYRHNKYNSISFIYVYLINDDLEYIVPFKHFDCISLDKERLNDLTSDCDIYVLAKKRFAKFYSGKCYDADLMAWWQTNQMLPLNETNTAAHDIWNRWWHNETDINDWLPITRHVERCQSMRKIFMEHYNKFKINHKFKRYESYAISNFWSIEQNGLQVDTKSYLKNFETDNIHHNKVYTEYNLYTSTGRPSNKFGGVNYAALNKDDGSRESFVSRFQKGMLLEFDYDAYHVRLIANIIDYELPEGSVHEYFGKQYFGVDELSEEQYEESKKITFRLLYGGIDKDFAKIPFFGKTQSYVKNLWNEFKTKKYIETPYFKRPMYKNNLNEMNPNKLFNYQLQATETEHNMLVLNTLNDFMIDLSSKLILYTYDSFLFDYDINDGKDVILLLKDIISEKGQYPVKLKAGINYNVMNDMTSKAV